MTIILANRLFALGHSVTFLVRYNWGEARELLDRQIPVIDMKLPENGKIEKNRKNLMILRKLLKNANYDAVLCVTIEMSQVAAVASCLTPGRKTPLISVIHNTVSAEKHSFDVVRRVLYPILDRQMNQVIAVSRDVAADYVRISRSNPQKVHTVYNPVISDKIFELAQEKVDHPWLTPERNFRTLILAGRLARQKNHELMFRALKILRKDGDYRLILLGIGEREMELKQVSSQMGLDDVIDFHGYEKNPYAYYAACDGVVLSSDYEGLPTVLIEAIGCGSRVISTDCPSGPREILGENEYGVLVPVKDADALAEGIKKALLVLPDKEKLKRRSLDFDIDSSAEGYLSVIEMANA